MRYEGTESPLFLLPDMDALENRIRELLGDILNETDSYLVDLRVLPGKVEVFADRDPHITIDDCVRINRTLIKKLDAEFPFSEQYTLEVSSPGMDQPFKVMRQFKKNIGRSVEVILISGEKKTGSLMYADEEKVVIEEKIAVSKKQTETRQAEIPFVQIKLTQLVFNFKF
jgi:ribosome maturation factor RimP